MLYATTIRNNFGLGNANSQHIRLICYFHLLLAPIHDNKTNFDYHYLRRQIDFFATHHDSNVHQII